MNCFYSGRKLYIFDIKYEKTAKGKNQSKPTNIYSIASPPWQWLVFREEATAGGKKQH
jgi:hypothetical protein